MEAEAVVTAVHEAGRIDTIEHLWRRSGVRVDTLRRMASADAFGSMGMTRQAALWQVRGLRDEKGELFENRQGKGTRRREARPPSGVHGNLPTIAPVVEVRQDYAALGLSLKAHPMAFLRRRLQVMQIVPCRVLTDEAACPNGCRIAVAGLVLIRQQPGTASGIVFMTIEDETGVANLIVRPRVFERDRKAARHGMAVAVAGRVERQGRVVHVMAHQFTDISRLLDDLASRSRDFH